MRRNVLVTSAGRRVSLVRGFQEVCAAQDRSLIAADAQPGESAACQVADHASALPLVGDPGFVEALAALCDRFDIGMVVPTIDTELSVLAAERECFGARGIHLVVSDEAFIADCADKRRTKQLFDTLGLARPQTYTWPDIPSYPIFAKPYNGSASEGIALLSNEYEAQVAVAASDIVMLCEYFDPADHDEFTIDCYYDRNGTLCSAVPRQRLEVRGGEVAKAVTARNELVDEMFDRMGVLAGARGLITVQAFLDRQNRTSAYIEINARVGGGYPLTRIAGADFQQLLVDEYLNDEPPSVLNSWRSGALMLRYDAEVVRFDV